MEIGNPWIGWFWSAIGPLKWELQPQAFERRRWSWIVQSVGVPASAGGFAFLRYGLITFGLDRYQNPLKWELQPQAWCGIFLATLGRFSRVEGSMNNDSGGLVGIAKRGVVGALGVLTGSYLLEGIYYEDNASLFLAVVVLALFSAILKPLLVLLALPFVVLTFGLGILFINALLYLLVGRLIDGFDVDTFGAAFFGALIITFFNVLFSGWIGRGPRGPRGPRRVGTRPVAKAAPVRPRRPVKAKDDVIDI